MSTMQRLRPLHLAECICFVVARANAAHLQGTILAAELRRGEPSFVWIELHEGYPFPVKGHRITCFKPDTGIMLAHYQDVVQCVEATENGRIRLEFNADFGQLYEPETAKAVEVGNLICLEVGFSVVGQEAEP